MNAALVKWPAVGHPTPEVHVDELLGERRDARRVGPDEPLGDTEHRVARLDDVVTARGSHVRRRHGVDPWHRTTEPTCNVPIGLPRCRSGGDLVGDGHGGDRGCGDGIGHERRLPSDGGRRRCEQRHDHEQTGRDHPGSSLRRTQSTNVGHRETVVTEHVHDLGDHRQHQHADGDPGDDQREADDDVGDRVVGEAIGERRADPTAVPLGRRRNTVQRRGAAETFTCCVHQERRHTRRRRHRGGSRAARRPTAVWRRLPGSLCDQPWSLDSLTASVGNEIPEREMRTERRTSGTTMSRARLRLHRTRCRRITVRILDRDGDGDGVAVDRHRRCAVDAVGPEQFIGDRRPSTSAVPR